MLFSKPQTKKEEAGNRENQGDFLDLESPRGLISHQHHQSHEKSREDIKTDIIPTDSDSSKRQHADRKVKKHRLIVLVFLVCACIFVGAMLFCCAGESKSSQMPLWLMWDCCRSPPSDKEFDYVPYGFRKVTCIESILETSGDTFDFDSIFTEARTTVCTLEEQHAIEYSGQRMQFLGKGAQGRVYRKRPQHDEEGATQRERAIKRIEIKTEEQRKDALGEVSCMLRLQACQRKTSRAKLSGTVTLHDLYRDDHYVYLVLEYCAGGTLCDYLVAREENGLLPLPEKEVALIAAQCFEALQYIHESGVAHRDLKPENIVFVNASQQDWLRSSGDSQLRVKLIDFGLAARFTGKASFIQTVGTLPFAAPEVLDPWGIHDEKCDVWSMGVTVYTMLYGQLPFPGDTQAKVLARIKEGLLFPETPCLSKEAENFIKEMLRVERGQRPTAKKCLAEATEWLSLLGINYAEWSESVQVEELAAALADLELDEELEAQFPGNGSTVRSHIHL